MSHVLKEAVISLDFIIDAYDYLFDLIKKETSGSISNPLVVPINFNINFLSFKKGNSTVTTFVLNGSLNSKIEQIKRNGYSNMHYSFKISTTEIVAKGLFKIKILDQSYIPKVKKPKLINSLI